MAAEGSAHGVVSDVRVHLVVSGGGSAGGDAPTSSVKSREVLSFLVHPTAGPPVTVEWRPKGARRIHQPPVADGDTVQVAGTQGRRYLQATRIDNQTRGTSVTGINVRRQTLVGLALFGAFAVVLAIVLLSVGVFSSHGSGGGQPPAAAPPSVTQPSVAAAPSGSGSGGGGVTVPNLAGLTNVAAAERLTAAGLRPDIVETASSGVAFGQVIATSPPAGTAVAPGASVRVELSCGRAVANICPPA